MDQAQRGNPVLGVASHTALDPAYCVPSMSIYFHTPQRCQSLYLKSPRFRVTRMPLSQTPHSADADHGR
jgi:hypothetical protein